MTRVGNVAERIESFKQSCYVLYDCSVNDGKLSRKDIELLLNFLHGLQTYGFVDMDGFGLPGNLQEFFLLSSTSVFIKYLQDFSQLELSTPVKSLVHFGLGCLRKGSGSSLISVATSLHCLLTWTQVPSDQQKQVLEAIEPASDEILSWKSIQPTRVSTVASKGPGIFFRLREPALASELWTEVTRFPSHPFQTEDSSSDVKSEPVLAELRLTALTSSSQAFWRLGGLEIVLTKLEEIPEVNFDEDAHVVMNTICTVELLSDLLMSVLVDVSHPELLYSVPTTNFGDRPAVPSSSISITVPESIAVRWIQLVNRQLSVICRWVVTSLTRLQRSEEPLADMSICVSDILTHVVKLHQLIDRLSQCDLSSKAREVLSGQTFLTGLELLQLVDPQGQTYDECTASPRWTYTVPSWCFNLSPSQIDRSSDVPTLPSQILVNISSCSQVVELILSLVCSERSFISWPSGSYRWLTSSCMEPGDSVDADLANFLSTLDLPIDVKALSQKQLTRADRLAYFSGRPLQLMLLRLSVGLCECASVFVDAVSRFASSVGTDEPQGQSIWNQIAVVIFKSLELVLSRLNGLLSMRASLIQSTAPVTNTQDESWPPTSDSLTDSMMGSYLAQLIHVLDTMWPSQHPTALSTGPTENAVRQINPEISKLIHLLASTSDQVTAVALSELGYQLTGNESVEQASVSTSWPLWPSSRVFCLFAGHVINTLRLVETTNRVEDILKQFWVKLLSSIQHSVNQLGSSQPALAPKLVDISPDLVQFTCFLGGQLPGLSAKKTLLNQLITCFAEVVEAHQGMNPTELYPTLDNFYRITFRMLVILRFTLHHFYVPPNYLAQQLKPSMFLMDKQVDLSSSSSALVWQYMSLVQRTQRTVTPLRPQYIDPCAPFFYDLLLSALPESNEMTKEKSPRVYYNLPAPDGLAILSLASQVNYDQLFAAPLGLLDLTVLMGGSCASVQSSPGSLVDTGDPRDLFAQCRRIPLCAYGLALSWRLLEILPPSVEFITSLHTLLTQSTSPPSSSSPTGLIPEQFYSPANLLYLVVLLDRLQGKATSPSNSFIYESCGASSSGRGTTTITTASTTKFSQPSRIPPSTPSESSLLKKGVQNEKQLAREIYRSVSVQTPSGSPAAESEPSTIVDDSCASFLSSTGAIRNLLASMRPSSVSCGLLFQVGASQLHRALSIIEHGIQPPKMVCTLGQMAYLIALGQFLTDLIPHLFSSMSAKLSVTAGTEDTKLTFLPKASTTNETTKRGGSRHRTRQAAEKTSQPSADSDSLQQKTNVLVDVLEPVSTESHTTASATEKPTGECTLDPVLTPDQLAAMQTHMVRTGQRLLLDSVRLLMSLVNQVRQELGFPTSNDLWTSLDSRISSSASTVTRLLTFLCPESLDCCSGGTVLGCPLAWTMNAPSRRRLAASLRLTMSAHRDQLDILRELSKEEQVVTTATGLRLTGTFTGSKTIFDRLSSQYDSAMYQLSDTGDLDDKQHESEMERIATSLARRLHLRQVCRLANTLSHLAVQLVTLLNGSKLKDCKWIVDTSEKLESEFHNALTSVTLMFLDPVANALGINLLRSGTAVAGISVAQYLAGRLLTYSDRPTKNPRKISDLGNESTVDCIRPSKSRRREQNVIVDYLEDHLLWIVINFVERIRTAEWDAPPSRVLTNLCREAIRFLEVVTGCPRVVRRCLRVDDGNKSSMSDSNNVGSTLSQRTFPLLRLFGTMRSIDSKTGATKPAKSVQIVQATKPVSSCVAALTYQSGLSRLLCVILLRAINAPTKTRHLFVQLATEACRACLFGEWYSGSKNTSLLHHWLTSLMHEPSVETAAESGTENSPWLIDLVSSGIVTTNVDLDTLDTEESVIVQALCPSDSQDRSLDAFYASAKDYNPTLVARWIAQRTQFRLAMYFERLCRLLTTSWTEDTSLGKSFCSHILTEAISMWRNPVLQLATETIAAYQTTPPPTGEQSVLTKWPCCVTLPWLISSLRCLCIGCPTGQGHVKLLGMLSAWAEAFVATFGQLQQPPEALHSCETASVRLLDPDRHDLLTIFSSSLRGIYDYGCLINCVLDPSFTVNKRDDGGGLPNLAYWETILDSVDPLMINTDEDTQQTFRSFTHLCSKLFSFPIPQVSRRPQRKRPASWAGRTLCDDTACHATSGSEHGDLLDELSDAESDLPDEESTAWSNRLFNLLGPIRNDHVCSYTGTQQTYIDQHWYHCHTCKLEYSEGVCSVCAQVCHAGHDLSYAKSSTFFCDCGAIKEPAHRCKALTCRIQSRNLYTFCGRFRPNALSDFVDSESLGFYAPWFADGYPDSTQPRSMRHRLRSLFGDSEETLAAHTQSEDYSDAEPSGGRRKLSEDLQKLKHPSKRQTTTISRTSNGQTEDTGTQPALITITPGATVTPADQTTEATATTQPSYLIRLRSPRRSGMASDSHGSTLRRTGAVRYRLTTSDVSTDHVAGGSITVDSTKPPKPLSKGTKTPQKRPNTADSSHILIRNTEPIVPCIGHRQRRLRCLRLREFLRTTFEVDYSLERRPAKEQSHYSFDSLDVGSQLDTLSLVADVATLIEHIRLQIDTDPAEKCRTNLIILLSTSRLVPHATKLFLCGPQEGSASLVDQLATSTSGSATPQEERRRALRRLLSCRREASPVVRLCHEISAPIPNMSDAHKDIWLRVLSVGRVLLHPVTGSSFAFDFNLHALDLLGLSSRSPLIPATPRMTPHSKSLRKTSAESPRLLVSASSEPPAEVQFTTQEPSSAPPPPTAPSSFAPATELSVLSPRGGTQSSEVTPSSNPSILLQTLVNLLANSDDNSSSPNPNMLSFLSLGNGTSQEAIRLLFPSNSTQSVMDLLAHRNLSAPTPGTPQTPSTATKSSGAIMSVLRVFQPTKNVYSHFLLVTGPELTLNAPRPEAASTTTPALSDVAQGGRMLNIYKLDHILCQLARYQDNGMLELAKLRLVTALLRTRHGRLDRSSLSLAPCEGSLYQPENLKDLRRIRPATTDGTPSVGQSAWELLSAISSGSSELTAPFQPFSIPFSELQRASVASVSFDVLSIAVNPVSQAQFAVCGAWECFVLGISSTGQITGRISISPKREDRGEQLIKAVWLPDSLSLLALLTSGSVQIFDIFQSPKEPKYHFKPVEGSFCDATFVRLPYKGPACTSAPSTTSTNSEPYPQEWGVHLVVMAKKMGSLLYQQLGPDCMSSTDPFYLAEWLDWSPEVLTLRAVDSDDDEDPAPPGLQRNPNTGVLGGGGVSLHYVASLGLLLHAYQSGHSVASAIHLPAVSDDNSLSTASTTQLKITYSFLLATGPRDNHPTHSLSSSSPFGLLSAESSVTSLLFAARGAINPSDLPSQPFSAEPNNRMTGPSVLPAIGPITRWSEVMGGHPGLISAVSLSNVSNANSKGSAAACVTNTLPHKPVLLAVEPDQIWVQPLQLPTSKTTLGSSRSGRSKRQSESTTPTTTADAAQRVGEELTASVAPIQTSLLDSCSVYWPGKQNLAGRTITFLLTADGRLLAHSTRPRSVVYNTESAVYPETSSPLSTYPGQFWWQPSMCSPELLSGLHNRLECLCSKDRAALSTGGILNFGLEQGGIWDLATADLPKALLTFPVPKKPNKALRRRLVESPSVGPLPADFFEHVTSTEEVDFAGAELLQTYNRDQLRRRLLTPGSPVTGAWTSVSSSGSNATGCPSSHKVAYIIEIHNRTPSETAIVGVRIGLPAATEEYATRWPKFIKVFNRIVPITPPSSGAMARMVDVALYRSEMLQSCKMLQVFVGCSADPDGLTSVDLVSVYTAPKSDLDTTRISYEGLLRRPSSIRLPSYGTASVGPLDLFVHRTPRLVSQANISLDASSAARAPPLADMKSICSTSTPSEHVLAYRLDRLFTTGFVTIAKHNPFNDRSCNRTISSVCVHPPPPLPPSPALLSSLIRLGDPPMIVVATAQPPQVHNGISCGVDRPLCGHPLQEVIFLTSSLCDLLTASLHWGTGAESLETSTRSTGVRLLLSCLEQVLSTPSSLMTMPAGARTTPHALDTIRSQVSRLLTSLLSNEQTMDPNCNLFGPFLWNLSRQLFRLIAVITQLVEQRKTCETGVHANSSTVGFQQPITNVVNSAVLQLTDICHLSSSRPLAADKLLHEFQHLTTFIHHLALVDPTRLRHLQEHHQLTKLVLTAFETVERYLPIPTYLRDPLHPVWINHCGLVNRSSPASHGSAAATVRAFVLSAVHCLYALLISTLSPDIPTPTHDIRMDERGERIYAILLNLLMHPNLSVSCAARDGLCRLLLMARPKYPIAWSVIDHRPEDDGYLPCRPLKFSLDDIGQTAKKTAATSSTDKSASRPTRESAPPPTSHFGRSSVTPYPARRRPQRNLAHAGNRMRPAWLSWENEANASTRIQPFERSLVRNLGTSSSSASSSILPAILDLENSTGWGAGSTDQQDAERFLNVIRLGRQLISSRQLPSSMQTFDDEEEEEEEEIAAGMDVLQAELNRLRDESQALQGELEDGDIGTMGDEDEEEQNDEDDLEEEDEDENIEQDSDEQNEEDEEEHNEDDDAAESDFDDEDADGADDADSDANLDLGDNAVLNDEMAVLLAQLLAEADQSSLEGSSLLGQLPWSLSSRLYDRTPQQQQQQQEELERQEQQTLSHDVTGRAATPRPASDSSADEGQPTVALAESTVHHSETEQTEIDAPNQSQVQVDLEQDWPAGTSGDEAPTSVDPAVDLEGIESAIQFLGSGSQEDPLALRDLLEQVDEDALLNYALRLSLRDQGGPGSGQPVTELSTDEAQVLEPSIRQAPEAPLVEDIEDSTATLQPAATDVGDPERTTVTTTKASPVQPGAQVQEPDSTSAPLASVVHVPTDADIPVDKGTTEKSERPSIPQPSEAAASDSDGAPCSHILSRSGSVDSFVFITDDTSTSHGQSSEDSSSDGPPYNGSLIKVVRCRPGAAPRSQRPALFFALSLAHQLAQKWPEFARQAALEQHSTPALAVRRFAPVLQLFVSLVRVIHANLVYLHVMLYAPLAKLDPTSAKFVKVKALLATVRKSLKNLIHVLLTSLTIPSVALLQKSTADSPSVPSETSLPIALMFSTPGSVALELSVMQLNALSEMFSRIPHLTRWTGTAGDPSLSSAALSLLQLLSLQPEEDVIETTTTGPAVVSSGTTAVRGDPEQANAVNQALELCLTMLEVLYSRIREGVCKTDPKEKASLNYPTVASNPSVAGLLQAALLGTANHNTGLLAETGASCLASWSPLLEAQFSLDHLANPLHEIGWIAMQACLRLPRVILLLRGTSAAARGRVRSAPTTSSTTVASQSHRKANQVAVEFESRWCSVLYDYLELVNSPELLNLQSDHSDPDHHSVRLAGRSLLPAFFSPSYPRSKELTDRIERQIRGLLIRIVGPKHYRQLHDIHRLAHLIQRVRDICVNTGEFLPSPPPRVPCGKRINQLPTIASIEPFVRRLRLSYICEREILQTISACLTIALNRTSYWQRFCLRCPDTLIFLFHASLVLDREIARNMLPLIQLAIAPETVMVVDSSGVETSIQATTEDQRRETANITTELRLAQSMANHLFAHQEDAEKNPSDNTADLITAPPLLLQFIRVFLCSCPQYTLRKSAAHIIRAIYRSISPSSQTRVLHLLSLLWSDLPTFAPYSSQFVQLITGMLIEHPEWSGRADLLERTFRTMLRRLDALKRHPRRILYATLMHLVQPHRDLWFTQSPSASGPTSTDSLSTTTSRRVPEPPGTVQRSTGTEPTLSRSWSVIASIKPTGTSHAATSTAAPTSTGTATISTSVGHQPTVSRSSSSTEATVDSNAVCLANLGFDFELEPCLMCHAKAIDEPFYVILRWDSEASGSRLPIQVAIMTMHSHYSKFVDRLKQAMGQQQQQLAQRHLISSGSSATTSAAPAAGSTTVTTGTAVGPAQLTTNVNHSGSSGAATNCSSPGSTSSHHPTMPMIPVKLDVRATSSIHVFDLDAVYLISQLTVKFNVLYKRPRYVRTLNVYTSELIDRATSRLIHEPWLWQKVATVHLSPNQTTVRLCFSQPAPTPTWLGTTTTTKDHATDDRFVSDQLSHRTGQSKEISYHGLPIRASRLIFEYADFHTNGTEAKRVCPRCHATNLLGSTCPACHTNVNECFRCRSINLSVGDVYLCANCGSSRHGKIEFSICARPCYSAVEPLHDREDRDSACNRIVSLSKELVKNAQTLARPIEIEVAQCLSDLVTMDAATAAAVTSVSLSRSNEPSSSGGGGGVKSKFSSQSAAIKSTPTADAKFILAAASSASSSLGSVHSGITRLAACVAEARAISLDAAAITRRLWATRQSVVEFDAAQQRCATAAEKRLTSNAVNHGTGGTDEDVAQWPNYEELDAVFSPSVSGCYSCLIHTVHQCGRLLLGVAEHTKIELVHIDPPNGTSREHWIFRGHSTTSNQRLQLVQDLISCLIESGLSVCPQAIQADLRELIVQLTRDCPVLIDHFGKVLFDRLFQTALAQGDQAYLLGPLVYTDIALLQTSVESILPPSQSSSSLSSSSLAPSVSDIPGRSQPMDQRAPYWEARLRPMFRLLVELTRPGLFEAGSDHGARPGSSIPLPVVQNILIPLMELMETIVSHSSPFAASAFVPSPAEPDLVPTDSADESRVPRTAGGSGESQPAAKTRAVTSDIVQLPPQTNFSEWLESRPHASYSAWCGALRDHSRSSGSDLVRPGLPAGSDNSNILASIPKTPCMDSTLEHSWITSILFCPSDPTSRCVHACMDLLHALSSDCPRSSNGHPVTGPNVADTHSSPTLALLYSRRRRVILRYLTQTCLPRLDELVAARGAAVSPSTLLNSSDASVFTMVLNPGDAFVAKWRKLTMVEEGADKKEGTDGDEDEGVSEGSRSTLISFLLDEVSFLDHLGTLVERLLLRLRILESMPIRHWDELVAATLSSASGTGAMHGSTPGYTIALVAELLRVLEPLKKLPGHHQYRLLQILLHACVRLRQLVLQRTECTLRAQGIFGTMLDQLIGVSSSQIREFLTTTLNVLAEYPVSDHQSAVYLLKRMCTPVCPLDVDQTVFHVSLEVWRGHEDYLLTRSRSELLSSDTRGLGPRIQNVIEYICTGNNLTTDMPLEIVCEGQILMPQLRLHDVYTQVWCVNRNNTNKPMRLVYRVPGLESDNLPYLEQLTTDQIPPEQYMHIGVLASHPHGLGDLLRRLATVQDPFQGRDLLDVIIHVLKYCLKTPECRQRLVDPELNSLPILLNVLTVCLQADETQSNQPVSDLHEDITKRLIQIIDPLLQLADEIVHPASSTSDQQPVLNTGDLHCVQKLLNCMSARPDLPVVNTDVAGLLGWLAFGDREKMNAIVDFLKVHLNKLNPTAQFTRNETALLDCCCAIMVAVPRHSRNGSLLRQKIVHEAGILETCLHFLWETTPTCVLDFEEGTTLNTGDPEIAPFLALPALPHILQALRACLGPEENAESLSQPEHYKPISDSNRARITADRLLQFFHLLESSKSAGRVGLLAEDMLSEWCPRQTKKSKKALLAENRTKSESSAASSTPAEPSGTLAEKIHLLRKATNQRTRRLARNMRERQLRSMNMRVDEKGNVAVVESDRLAKMTAVVTEEVGLSCAICHEGFRNAPDEALGIYVFVRQCPLEEVLVFGAESDQSPAPPISIPQGYSTLSSFVVVHFSCHFNSLKASFENQWIVAQRHNRDARCNNILPILGPPAGTFGAASSETRAKAKKDQPPAPETVYAGHLANFMDYIMRSLNVSPGYLMALHDVKILLLRFACNRQFHSETGGGGAESNMQLLPHLMQVGLHSLLMSSAVTQKVNELKEFLDLPESHWSSTDHCWNSTGPLYRTVTALHVWPPEMWQRNRVALLRRLIHLACGRLKQGAKSDTQQDPEVRFLSFKPYLLFYGLVDGAYEHLFKNISTSSAAGTPAGAGAASSSSSWCASLSQYISTSDEALLAAVPRFLNYYQTDLLPIVSLEEFLDVTGLLSEVDAKELTTLMGLNTN